MTQDDLNKILELHKKWLNGDPDGKRAYLSRSNLRGSNLRGSDLRDCDLRDCYLSGSNLSGCNLSGCNLRGSDLSDCDLSRSNLSGCDLSGSDLSGSDLSGCDLRGSNLSGCDLSGSDGLISPIQYMDQHYERCADGYVAYKTFNTVYIMPSKWGIAPGAVIEETVNANRTDICGCGINVAPLDWVKQRYDTGIWKVLIRWEWLPGVCVPYNTDGKIRCERVQLLEIVE